jgi:hypothetical protein
MMVDSVSVECAATGAGTAAGTGTFGPAVPGAFEAPVLFDEARTKSFSSLKQIEEWLYRKSCVLYRKFLSVKY